MIKFEFKADISKDGSVKIEFARPLSEDERKIMEVHGFRLSGTAGAWTRQSSGGALRTCGNLSMSLPGRNRVSANGDGYGNAKGYCLG